MKTYMTLLFLALGAIGSLAQNCSFTAVTCPADAPNGAFCESESSLTTNIIVRCRDGCPQPGNCNDNLAGVRPVGVKQAAYCWQESDTSYNAQCTFDCVKVTALNGSMFYPVGCSFTIQNGTGAPSSTSLTNLPTMTDTPSTSSPTPTAVKNAAAIIRVGHALIVLGVLGGLVFAWVL